MSRGSIASGPEVYASVLRVSPSRPFLHGSAFLPKGQDLVLLPPFVLLIVLEKGELRFHKSTLVFADPLPDFPCLLDPSMDDLLEDQGREHFSQP